MSPSSAKKRFGIETLTGFRFDIGQGPLREPAGPWFQKLSFLLDGQQLPAAVTPVALFKRFAPNLIANLPLHSNHSGRSDTQHLCGCCIGNPKKTGQDNAQSLAQLSGRLVLFYDFPGSFYHLVVDRSGSGHLLAPFLSE